MKNGQTRDTGNIERTSHIAKTKTINKKPQKLKKVNNMNPNKNRG